MSCLEADAGFFKLLMKGIFDPYVLWPVDKKLISWLVTRIRVRHYTASSIPKQHGRKNDLFWYTKVHFKGKIAILHKFMLLFFLNIGM